MDLDFQNETYVRVYTRNSTEWCLAGFEGQTVFMHVTRVFDRAGCLNLCGQPPAQVVSLQTGIPLPFAERGLARLLQVGVLEHRGDFLVDPTYVPAQESSKSDKQRQRDSRDRRRSKAMESQIVTSVANTEPNVTVGHERSQSVTLCPAVPSVAGLGQASAVPPPAAPAEVDRPPAPTIPRIGVDTSYRRPLGHPDPRQEAEHARSEAERLKPLADAKDNPLNLSPDGLAAQRSWTRVCGHYADLRGFEPPAQYEAVGRLARAVVTLSREHGFDVPIADILVCAMFTYYARQRAKSEKGRVLFRFLPLSDDFTNDLKNGTSENPPSFRPKYTQLLAEAGQ